MYTCVFNRQGPSGEILASGVRRVFSLMLAISLVSRHASMKLIWDIKLVKMEKVRFVLDSLLLERLFSGVVPDVVSHSCAHVLNESRCVAVGTLYST